MADLLEPKDVEIAGIDGKVRKFIISKFPAIAGREIVAKYPLSAMPKLGDYAVNEETMFKLMAYVGVAIEGNNVIRLDTRAKIDNHVPEWETLMKIELEMMKYNTSFFGKGEISSFLKTTIQKSLQSISPMLKDWSGQLLDQVKQHSANLEKSTRSKKR
jgi:hypothetical protein